MTNSDAGKIHFFAGFQILLKKINLFLIKHSSTVVVEPQFFSKDV